MSLQSARDASPSVDNQIKCERCAASTRLLQKFLNARTGGTVRIYRCECGEQMWRETKE